MYQGLFSCVDEKESDVNCFDDASNCVDGDDHHAVFGFEIAVVQKQHAAE